MESGDDTDTRKKRDSSKTQDGTCRNNGPEPPERGHRSSMSNTKKREERNVSSGDATEKSLDVETALHALFQPEGFVLERLSDQAMATFRVGHSWDAPAIDLYYRQSQGATTRENVKENVESGQDNESRRLSDSNQAESPSSLEVWLSEAMGNEDTPPSLFSILAEISSPTTKENEEDGSIQKRSNLLGAVVLFTLTYEGRQRMIQLEWFHVGNTTLAEKQVVEQRIWLLLSTLALMTGACLNATTDFRRDDCELT